MPTRSLKRGRAEHIAAGLIFWFGVWTIGTAPGWANSIPLSCATRDLALVTLIEKHGERQDVSAERLATATLVLQVARKACSAARADVALEIYDLIESEIIRAVHRR